MKPRFFAALLIVSLPFTPAVAGPPVRIVALTNTQPPGIDTGSLFSYLGIPALNSRGQTAFYSSLLGGGTSSDASVWSEGTGSLALVVREGAAAPGTEAGVTFGEMSTPVLSDSGASVFWSSLNGGSNPDNGEGYWSHANGSLSLLARPGNQAPDTEASVLFSAPMAFHSHPVISDNGTIALSSFIYGPGVDSVNNRGIWTQSTGDLTLAYRSGTQAPGLDAGVLITGPTVLFTGPVVNDAGMIAFHGTLIGPGIGATNNQSVWSTVGGALHMVARTGSQAPGAPAGVTFTDFDMFASIMLNNSGEIAFQGSTSDGGYGIWSDRDGLHAVARSGQSTPGLPGETFRDFANAVLNASGHVAFSAFLTSGKQGLWSEGNGELTLVANAGDQAPGAPTGVTFFGFGNGSLNGRGQLAFKAFLTGLESADANGIWVHDVDGLLRAIVRSGDSIEVAPGDVRTVSSVGFVGGSGNEDGRHSAFNDLGQLAFQASFTDGTQGIFVTDIVAIPEPAASVLALLAFGVVRCRRGL